MSALISALTDLIKTFCLGLVSLFSVPAKTLYASFGSYVFVLPFAFAVFAFLCRKIFVKKNDRPELLNNKEKEKKE